MRENEQRFKNVNGRIFLVISCDVCGVDFLRRKSTKADNKACKSCINALLNPIPDTGDRIKRNRCVDCGVKISKKSKRCRACSSAFRIVKRAKCVHCGKEISRKAKSMCISCHNKNQDKGKSIARTKFNASKTWAKVRKECFERDGYTCQICMAVGGELNAHHIDEWAKNKERRLDITNLQTLCVKCHRKVHRERNKKANSPLL